jgi:hypothetical protein
MPQFNTYETLVDHTLGEGKFSDVMSNVKSGYSDITAGLKYMTGSDLFDSTGVAGNKYNKDKRYYPNIKGAVKNTSSSEADQKLLTRIEKLKQDGKYFADPEVGVQRQPVDYQKFVSELFSMNYIQNAQTKISEDIKKAKEIIQPFQHYQIPVIRDLIQAVGMFESTKDDTNLGLIKLYVETFIQVMPVAPISLLLKSHLDVVAKQLKELTAEWELLMTSSNHRKVKVDNKPPIGDFLDHNGKVYRDLWEVFLNSVQNGVVGTTQRGFAGAPGPYNIITGGQRGKYMSRGQVNYTDDTKTVSPDIVKKFHNDIMVPLFITSKNPTLLYLTPEQWEEISKGSTLWRGALGLGKQAFSAGQARPKVSL